MIARATKLQLVAFAILTVVGSAFVGGKYAHLDRLVVSRTYPVVMQLNDSGGIFATADVTYRGYSVGRVEEMKFNADGVEAILAIEKSAVKIPDDVIAVVATKSAIGEQYVDLEPQRSGAPYLKSGSQIPVDKTRVPIDTAELLTNLDDLVHSVPPEDLHTLVHELGASFQGTGSDLRTLLDNTSAFIDKANANLGVTRRLIDDSSRVLDTQVASGSYIRAWARDLALLSDTLVASDPDLRKLIGPGSVAASGINTIFSANSADLSTVIGNLVGPTHDLNANRQGLEIVLVLYPYLVQGSFTVLTPHTENGTIVYNADFGLPGGGIGGGSNLPPVCDAGNYRPRRSGADITDVADFAPSCGVPSLIPRRVANVEWLPRAGSSPASSTDGSVAWLLTMDASSP
jgi:phospholipid/cholesterol/gamma-HCH transport system substrate-binding protein